MRNIPLAGGAEVASGVSVVVTSVYADPRVNDNRVEPVQPPERLQSLRVVHFRPDL